MLLLLIVAGVAAQLFFTNKVKKALNEQVPKEVNLTYSELSTNVFLGEISLTEVSASSPDGRKVGSSSREAATARLTARGMGSLPAL